MRLFAYRIILLSRQFTSTTLGLTTRFWPSTVDLFNSTISLRKNHPFPHLSMKHHKAHNFDIGAAFYFFNW